MGSSNGSSGTSTNFDSHDEALSYTEGDVAELKDGASLFGGSGFDSRVGWISV